MRNKFILIFMLSLILYSAFLIPTAKATDSSPSADIKDKLKQLQAEIASRAADIKNEVSKKLLNKAYIGEIKTKDASSLAVSLKTGQGNITVNEFTEYIIKSRSLTGDAGFKNLAVSDFVASLGDVDDNGVMTAKLIVRVIKPTPKKIIYGPLSSLVKNTAVVTTNQKDQFSVTFDKNTDYQLNGKDSSFSDIKENQMVIVVGEEIKPSSPSAFLAKFVYINSSASAKPKS